MGATRFWSLAAASTAVVIKSTLWARKSASKGAGLRRKKGGNKEEAASSAFVGDERRDGSGISWRTASL